MRSSKRWWLAVATCTLAIPALASDAPLRMQQAEVEVGGEEETPVGEQVVIETEEVEVRTEDEARNDTGGRDKGLYALIGGGAEVYTHELASRLDVGPAAGVAVGVKAEGIGFEAAYSGAALEAERDLGEGLDILRNGGQFALTIPITSSALQPFVMGGAGYEWFNVRNEGPDETGAVTGFEDAGNIYVPAGLGVRYQPGPLIMVDLRATYNFLIDEDFGPGEADGDRIQALATLGGTF